MLASEILNRNWNAALEELNRLKEIIDSKVFLSHLLIVCSLLRLHLYMWFALFLILSFCGRTSHRL
jgi:translation initiation factor 3 subunit E